MCDSKGGHSTSGGHGCSCGCCGCGSFSRRFITKKEKMECLENYREQLKKELEGLEEHIQDFSC